MFNWGYKNVCVFFQGLPFGWQPLNAQNVPGLLYQRKPEKINSLLNDYMPQGVDVVPSAVA